MVGIFDLTGLNQERFEFSNGLLQAISANWGWIMRFVAVMVAGLVLCGSTLVASFMAYNERREDVAEK